MLFFFFFFFFFSFRLAPEKAWSLCFRIETLLTRAKPLEQLSFGKESEFYWEKGHAYAKNINLCKKNYIFFLKKSEMK